MHRLPSLTQVLHAASSPVVTAPGKAGPRRECPLLQWRRVRWAAPLTLFLAGCSVNRTTPAAPGGVHPPGWADPTSSAFHAGWLEANGFPLSQCQACHGDDYAGGAVGVSCTQAGCHTSGPPTSCTTCHGANGTPRPQTGAHWDHLNFCDTCHVVPTTAQVQEHASADASTIVQFSGLAVQGGAQPSFDATNMQCANVYCHFGKPTPAWTSPTPIPCDGCHGAPPADHAAWSRLATSDISLCLTCHPGFTDPRHVNGVVDITISSCTTCHGSEGHANPPVSLSGSTDPTTRGVGAHDRHLNPSLPDRISEPVACSSCHPVPASITSPGHSINRRRSRSHKPARTTRPMPPATCGAISIARPAPPGRTIRERRGSATPVTRFRRSSRGPASLTRASKET